MKPKRRGRSLRFEYYVFWSKDLEPTTEERAAGVYLTEMAESRYLQRFFDPLYDLAGVGISTSDDEVISGEAIQALKDAVSEAIADIRVQPDLWPVTVGYRMDSDTEDMGSEMIRSASKSRLTRFLAEVLEIIEEAQRASGYVHFGGGG